MSEDATVFIERLAAEAVKLEFHDADAFQMFDKMLAVYGYTLMPTRQSVGDKTVAVIRRREG